MPSKIYEWNMYLFIFIYILRQVHNTHMYIIDHYNAVVSITTVGPTV